MSSDQLHVGDLYNVNELKSVVDDSLRKVLTIDLQFEESYFHSDIQLALGTATVVVAASTFIYGLLTPFDAAFHVVKLSTCVYVILATMASIHLAVTDQRVVMHKRRNPQASQLLGKLADVQELSIATLTQPCSLDYAIDIRTTHEKFKIFATFKLNQWFDSNGLFHLTKFRSDIAKLLEL